MPHVSNQHSTNPSPTPNSTSSSKSGQVFFPPVSNSIQQFTHTYSRRNASKNVVQTETLYDHEDEPESRTKPAHLDLPIAVMKGMRSCTRYSISDFLGYAHLSPSMKALLTQITKEKIPESFQQAWHDTNWKKAVLEEMNALEKTGTWEIIDRPKGKKTVGCKWVFTLKYKSDGSIERYKARLVAKGYS